MKFRFASRKRKKHVQSTGLSDRFNYQEKNKKPGSYAPGGKNNDYLTVVLGRLFGKPEDTLREGDFDAPLFQGALDFPEKFSFDPVPFC